VPELPEVETMVRGIRPHVEGRRIIEMRACPCTYKPIDTAPKFEETARRSVGQSIVRVRRLAKRVVMELSSNEMLVIEPRMTGLMLLGDPPDTEHLRVQWQLETNGRRRSLWFWDRRGLGTLQLYSRQQFAEAFGPETIGPDALETSRDELRRRCAGTSRAIKVALLDQKFVAGIGNLYASEILNRAGIHPERRANDLSRRHIALLWQSMKDVLDEAIRHEGSTLSDGTYRNALNRTGRYQNEHRVYMRAGQRCRRCNRGIIRRIVQAQRSTFFCPCCQRPGRNGRGRPSRH